MGKDRLVDATLYDLNFPVTFEQLCMLKNIIKNGIDTCHDSNQRIELRTVLLSLYAVQMGDGRTFGDLVQMIEGVSE